MLREQYSALVFALGRSNTSGPPPPRKCAVEYSVQFSHLIRHWKTLLVHFFFNTIAQIKEEKIFTIKPRIIHL